MLRLLKVLFLCGLILYLSGHFFHAQAGPRMKTGLWEITTQIEMPGMGMTMPGMTYRQCIKQETPIPYKKPKDMDCKVLKQKTTGSTLSWHMRCRDREGTSDIRGKVTYKGKTMTGTIQINQAGMSMTQKMTGRWVGRCK